MHVTCLKTGNVYRYKSTGTVEEVDVRMVITYSTFDEEKMNDIRVLKVVPLDLQLKMNLGMKASFKSDSIQTRQRNSTTKSI